MPPTTTSSQEHPASASAAGRVTVDGVGALHGGDAIVAVDGKPIDTSAQLADAVALRKPGDKLSLQVEHDGASRTVQITLGATPADV